MTEGSLFPSLGLFDVHSHLLPGVDDGCKTVEESVQCARRMVEAGYTHSFCTPHFWPSFPKTTIESVPGWVEDLQINLDKAGVPLKLYPGSEINMRPGMTEGDASLLPTFGMEGKFALIDLWADRLPPFFEPTIRWMQAAGMTVILAHPERMRAVQDEPELADYLRNWACCCREIFNASAIGRTPPRASRLSDFWLKIGISCWAAICTIRTRLCSACGA